MKKGEGGVKERDGKEEGRKNAERGRGIERIHDVGHLILNGRGRRKGGEGEGEEERGGRREREKKREGKKERGGEEDVASYSGRTRRGNVSLMWLYHI